MFLEILAFFVGCLTSIIDYMNDSNLFLNYKFIAELLFFCTTLYFFLSNKYISFFGSGLFVVGGFVGSIITPHAIEAFIWKSVIYLAIPVFMYHILNVRLLINDLSSEDIRQFIFKVIPIVIGSLLLALVEDYMVPEEYSNKKLYDKIFQFVVLLIFLYMLNNHKIFINLTDLNKLILNIFTISWFGNIVSGIFILSSLSHLFAGKTPTL